MKLEAELDALDQSDCDSGNRKQQIRERYKKFEELSPAQRKRLLDQRQRFKSLSKERRQELHRRFRDLSPAQKAKIRKALRDR